MPTGRENEMTATFTAPATVDQLLNVLSTIPTDREAKGEGWSTEFEYEHSEISNSLKPIGISLTVEVAEPIAALDHAMNLGLMFGIANHGWQFDECTENDGRHYMSFQGSGR